MTRQLKLCQIVLNTSLPPKPSTHKAYFKPAVDRLFVALSHWQRHTSLEPQPVPEFQCWRSVCLCIPCARAECATLKFGPRSGSGTASYTVGSKNRSSVWKTINHNHHDVMTVRSQTRLPGRNTCDAERYYARNQDGAGAVYVYMLRRMTNRLHLVQCKR